MPMSVSTVHHQRQCAAYSQVKYNVRQSHRQRQYARENIVLSIKADWEINKPKKAILHWDSKLFHFDRTHNEERVAVFISRSLNGYLFIFLYKSYVYFLFLFSKKLT